jgi:hypothetical protein
MNALWLVSVLLISILLRKTAGGMVNVPNKDYWLATDERRRECARLMNTMMFGISFLTNLMWGVIYHGIIQSNIKTIVHVDMWMVFAPVVILLVFTLVFLLTAFRKPAAPDE